MEKNYYNNQNWNLLKGVSITAGIAFVLFLHGALPFLMSPSLGSAVWTTGFSESFANGPWYTIYAHDFGIPKPAAIAYGLAGAWPASLLIRFGLHPSDAYSGMLALWLLVGFFSAYKMGRKFGSQWPIAFLGAMAWMSMPIIWAHAGYSMLSLGIGLQPFYFLATIKLFWEDAEKSKVTLSTVVFYFLTTIISTFMDGYTFMMFAMGSSILYLFTFISRPEIRKTLLQIALPIHIVSFTLAYILYVVYIGKSSFNIDSIDFFRGWGLDLSFAVFPTKGMLWLPDILRLSLERSDEAYFGDASVWITTFSLPVILAGLTAWCLVKTNVKLATGVLIVAAFGFYMALGPSLKVHSTKPESMQHSQGTQHRLMPADLALMPTGNAWISEKLPGFKNMRASYRWSALGIFALWMLIMIGVAHTDKKGRAIWGGILLGLIAFNLPNLPDKWHSNLHIRAMFLQLDSDLVTELQKQIKKGETVAFLPWGNDFMVNHLAPRAGFRTFNIGGDKNLADAQTQWPSEMFSIGEKIDSAKALTVAEMLINGSANVIVVPYFHMLWSVNVWPCIEQQPNLPDNICPAQRKKDLSSLIKTLRTLPYLEVEDSNLFATIRLNPKFSGFENREYFIADLLSKSHYPAIVSSGLQNGVLTLRKGWHALEQIAFDLKVKTASHHPKFIRAT